VSDELTKIISIWQEGDPAQAADMARELCRSEECTAINWALCGRIELDMGNLATARSCLQQALRLNPSLPYALAGMGDLCDNEGDRTGAIRFYEDSLRVEPTVARRIILGSLLRQEGRTDESVILLSEAAQLEPENDEAHVNRAMSLEDAGRVEEAEDAYRTVLDLSESQYHVRALELLGQLYCDQRRLDEAESMFLKALAIAPDVPAYRGRARLCELREDARGAESAFRAALGYSPDDVVTLVDYGCWLIRQRRHDEAEQTLMHANSVDPDSLNTWVALARLYRATGDRGRQAACLRSALDVAPERDDIRTLLDQCLD
jgi:tetratricopeptide (TPR) repeat protein